MHRYKKGGGARQLSPSVPPHVAGLGLYVSEWKCTQNLGDDFFRSNRNKGILSFQLKIGQILDFSNIFGAQI